MDVEQLRNARNAIGSVQRDFEGANGQRHHVDLELIARDEELRVAHLDVIGEQADRLLRIKERRARFGRNPRTGESVPVPPRKVVVFKSGLEMKAKVK